MYRAEEDRGETHLGVGVSQLDGNISLELILEPHRLHPRDGLDCLRLSVGDVTNRTCAVAVVWGKGEDRVQRTKRGRCQRRKVSLALDNAPDTVLHLSRLPSGPPGVQLALCPHEQNGKKSWMTRETWADLSSTLPQCAMIMVGIQLFARSADSPDQGKTA